jgi:hypothetical protein
MDHACQDRLVVRQKFDFAFLLIEKVMLIWIGDCLILLADDLHQGCKVDVVLLADWNVDK